jgi:hypothetical protein
MRQIMYWTNQTSAIIIAVIAGPDRLPDDGCSRPEDIMRRASALSILNAESGLARYFAEIRRFPLLEPQEEFMLMPATSQLD